MTRTVEVSTIPFPTPPPDDYCPEFDIIPMLS